MTLQDNLGGPEGPGDPGGPRPAAACGDDPVLDLATALSVAVRVEPELVRAVRLALFPRFGVETEADLWFSEHVRSRGAAGFVFDTARRHRLQRRLARRLRGLSPDDPLHSLWRVVARVHRDVSPALLLEERVTWLAVAGLEEEIDNALAPVFKAVVKEHREGLKQWLVSAWDRLPQAVRDSSMGWQLAHAARPRFPAGRFPSTAERAPLPAGRLGDLVGLLDDIRITVRRDGDELEIDGRAVETATRIEVPPGAYALPVPDTAPRLLTVLSGVPGGPDHDLAVPANWQIRVRVGTGPVQLRTARGHVFLVPPRAAPEPAGALGGRFLGISVTRYDDDLLPPLGDSADRCRAAGAALGGNYAEEYLADPSLEAVVERLNRLTVRHGGPLVVYFRGYAVRPGTLALRDSDLERPATFLGSEALFRLATASGADQVLVVLDTVRPPGGDDGWRYSPPPIDLGRATWAGQIASAVPHDTGRDGPFGSWLLRVLRRGPDEVPQGWGWSPRNPFVTGGDLMRAVDAVWPGGTSSSPRNFAAGIPRGLLPNPRYALRNFPDDVRPADFGEVYAHEAAAFLREVISDVDASADDRERAVTNMLLLGPERGIEAATALGELAEQHAAGGRPADAVAAHEAAISVLRPLTGERPDAALPALGASLYGVAGLLAEAYRWGEAGRAAEEAVAIARRLAGHQEEYRPRLAESLHLWSRVLHGVGQHRAALAAADEAVDLLRRLASEEPGTHGPALAVSLTSLANRLGAVGRRQDALGAAAEAVIVRRAQASWHLGPDARAALAVSLHVRWYWERGVREWDKALRTIVECVTLRRELAAQRPGSHRPELAESLNCTAISLADLNRIDNALVNAREAVAIYSELVAHGAVDMRQSLARSQRNLALWLCTLGRAAEAVTAASDAVYYYRELDAEVTGLHRADLADALEMLSRALDLLAEGRPRAEDAAREAVALYRQLAAARPEQYRRDLARSLNTLSIRLDTLGRTLEAARLREEVQAIVYGWDGWS